MVAWSNVLGTLTPNHVNLLPAVFFQFHLEQRWGIVRRKVGMIPQERLKIEVKLLLSANRKSYMPRRLAQQRVTLNDLEWLSHASRAISAVVEFLVICVSSYTVSLVNTLHANGVSVWIEETTRS